MKTTSEILDGAAGVIERNGLVFDSYYGMVLEDSGREKDPRTCTVCPRSAIAVALGRHPMFVSDWPENCASPGAPDPAELADRTAIAAAESALERHLVQVAGYRPSTGMHPTIEDWADQSGRTLAQVLEALRGCAQAERRLGR